MTGSGRWRTPQGAPVVIQKSKQPVSSPHEHRETAEPKVLPVTVRTDGVKVPKSSSMSETDGRGVARGRSPTGHRSCATPKILSNDRVSGGGGAADRWCASGGRTEGGRGRGTEEGFRLGKKPPGAAKGMKPTNQPAGLPNPVQSPCAKASEV